MAISDIQYDQWISKFMTAWKDRDVTSVVKLISPDCQYYENVFKKPCNNLKDIEKLWLVVPSNQKNIKFSYHIIASNKNFCIINFLLKRTLIPQNTIQDINGIFQISLNQNGQCTFFKQWRATKEI